MEHGKDSEPWTMIKEADGTNSQEINLSEESDGISVISESEMYKPTVSSTESENEMERTITADVDDFQPLTPPQTPRLDDCIEKVDETVKQAQEEADNKSSKKFYVCIVFAGVLFLNAVLCFLVARHRNAIVNLRLDFHALSARFEALEQENQHLKTLLSELEARFQNDDVGSGGRDTNPSKDYLMRAPQSDNKERRAAPITKKVWLGNEIEDRVEILDKKRNSLPDYCYFTDESDLFYDYNVEICENKRRKLEAKNSRDKEDNKGKFVYDPNLDSIWKTENPQSYDDYIAETLKSLNDEIQKIKNNRVESDSTGIDNLRRNADNATTANVIEADQEKPTKSKKSKKRRDKKKNQDKDKATADEFGKEESTKAKKPKNRKKLQRQKEMTSGEWAEMRMNGREEARKSHEMQQEDINWYLKRKNEREIDRLATAGGQEL